MECQCIEGAANRLDQSHGDVKVSCRGANVSVTEQMLAGAKVGTGFEHVRHAGVAEQVRVYGLLDAGPLTGISAGVSNGVIVEGRPTRMDEGNSHVVGRYLWQ